MEINKDASNASSEIEVTAPCEVVWDVLTDLEGWPSWNPDVKSLSMEGSLTEGTRFTWKAGPSTLKSVLELVDRPHRAGWTGRTMGISAIHVWQLQPREDRTVVYTEESWEGLIPSVLRGWSRKTLQKSLDDALANLKVEAERRASTEP